MKSKLLNNETVTPPVIVLVLACAMFIVCGAAALWYPMLLGPALAVQVCLPGLSIFFAKNWRQAFTYAVACALVQPIGWGLIIAASKVLEILETSSDSTTSRSVFIFEKLTHAFSLTPFMLPSIVILSAARYFVITKPKVYINRNS